MKFNNLHDIVFDSTASLKSKDYALNGTQIIVQGIKSQNGQPLLNFLGNDSALKISANEEENDFDISKIKLSK